MENRIQEAKQITEEIFSSPKYYFKDLKPSLLIDKLEAVYAITDMSTGEVLYVGRTKNIR